MLPQHYFSFLQYLLDAKKLNIHIGPELNKINDSCDTHWPKGNINISKHSADDVEDFRHSVKVRNRVLQLL